MMQTKQIKRPRFRQQLFGLLAVLLAAMLWALPAHADTYYTEGGFQYSIVGQTVSIHSYFSMGATVEIPAMIAEEPGLAGGRFAAGCCRGHRGRFPSLQTP